MDAKLNAMRKYASPSGSLASALWHLTDAAHFELVDHAIIRHFWRNLHEIAPGVLAIEPAGASAPAQVPRVGYRDRRVIARRNVEKLDADRKSRLRTGWPRSDLPQPILGAKAALARRLARVRGGPACRFETFCHALQIRGRPNGLCLGHLPCRHRWQKRRRGTGPIALAICPLPPIPIGAVEPCLPGLYRGSRADGHRVRRLAQDDL